MNFARLFFLVLTVLAVTSEAFTLEHSLSKVDQVQTSFEISIESEDLADDQETWDKGFLSPWLRFENRKSMRTPLCEKWVWYSQQRFTLPECGLNKRRHRWLTVDLI